MFLMTMKVQLSNMSGTSRTRGVLMKRFGDAVTGWSRYVYNFHSIQILVWFYGAKEDHVTREMGIKAPLMGGATKVFIRQISNVLVSVQILPLMMINLYHAPAYVVLMREVSTELVVVVNAPQRARVSEKKATKIMMSANLSAKLRHSPVIVMREPVSA